MMEVRCYLGPSNIEGLGVFAAEEIPEGAVVWRFDRLLDQSFPKSVLSEKPSHIREFLERYSYPHFENPDYLVLDGDEGRFMNHSDRPNLDFRDPEFGVANRRIAAGEELTCDYAGFSEGALVFQPPRHLLSVSVAAE